MRYLRFLAILAPFLAAIPSSDAETWLVTTPSPPLVFEESEKGLLIDLMRDASRRVGDDIRVKYLPWKRALVAADQPEPVFIFPLSRTPELEARFQWIAPIFSTDTLFVSKARPVNSLREASTLRVIGVRAKTIHEDILAKFGLANVMAIVGGDIPAMLRIDRVDAWFTTRLEAQWAWERMGAPSDIQLGESLGTQVMWLAASDRVPPSLAASYKAAFASQTRDGAYYQILRRYFSNYLPISGRSLRIATVDNIDTVRMRDLSGEFERRNPDIRLDWLVTDENRLRELITTDILSGSSSFDVISVGQYEAPIWGRLGWLQPISELPESYGRDDLIAPVLDGLSVDGTPYALPFYGESIVTYYRKDVFQELGLSMPERPLYADIGRFARAIGEARPDMHGICLRGKPGWGQNVALLSALVRSGGGRWFDSGAVPQLDRPVWRDAVSFYVDLVSTSGPPAPETLGYNELLELSLQGKCAIWIDATVAAGALFDPERSRVADKIALAPAPALRVGVKGTPWLWAWALAIPSNTERKGEARRFLEWATSRDYIDLVAERFGWQAVPPGTRYSLYDNPDYRKTAPFAQDVVAAIDDAAAFDQSGQRFPGRQFVAIPEFQAIGSILGTLVADALADKRTVDSALQAAQREVQAIMVQSGYITK